MKIETRHVYLFAMTVLFSLLLQACRTQTVNNTETQQRQNTAASYNTQLGLAYLKQGDMPRAKQKLLTALHLAPQAAVTQAAMAYYFEKTGDLNNAQIYYKKALQLAPNDGMQLNHYGAFLCRTGRYQEAERYFIRATQDIQYVNTAAAYENAGLCAAANSDLKKASTYYIQALKADPKRKQSLVELTTLLIKQKQPDKALQYINQYRQLALTDSILLALAKDAAHAAGNDKLAAAYQARLVKMNNHTDFSGDKNEYKHADG